MTDSTAKIIVALTLSLVWFLGLATVAFLIWHFVVSEAFGLPSLRFVDAVAAYALLRLIIKPPELTIEMN